MNDTYIVVVALIHDLKLVTADVAHFKRIEGLTSGRVANSLEVRVSKFSEIVCSRYGRSLLNDEPVANKNHKSSR